MVPGGDLQCGNPSSRPLHSRGFCWQDQTSQYSDWRHEAISRVPRQRVQVNKIGTFPGMARDLSKMCVLCPEEERNLDVIFPIPIVQCSYLELRGSDILNMDLNQTRARAIWHRIIMTMTSLFNGVFLGWVSLVMEATFWLLLSRWLFTLLDIYVN